MTQVEHNAIQLIYVRTRIQVRRLPSANIKKRKETGVQIVYLGAHHPIVHCRKMGPLVPNITEVIQIYQTVPDLFVSGVVFVNFLTIEF